MRSIQLAGQEPSITGSLSRPFWPRERFPVCHSDERQSVRWSDAIRETSVTGRENNRDATRVDVLGSNPHCKGDSGSNHLVTERLGTNRESYLIIGAAP